MDNKLRTPFDMEIIHVLDKDISDLQSMIMGIDDLEVFKVIANKDLSALLKDIEWIRSILWRRVKINHYLEIKEELNEKENK